MKSEISQEIDQMALQQDTLLKAQSTVYELDLRFEILFYFSKACFSSNLSFRIFTLE